MIEFHKTLSESSVYFVISGCSVWKQRILHERLARVCFIDYDREIALVADLNEADGTRDPWVGRLTKEHGSMRPNLPFW